MVHPLAPAQQISPARVPHTGVSLIEVVVAVAVIALIASVAISGLVIFRRQSLLNAAAEMVASALHEARTRTLASDGGFPYGVHVASDRIIRFRGATYPPGDPNNTETVLPTGIEIAATALAGGGADVVFTRLTGATAHYGTVTLQVRAAPASVR